MAKLPFDNRKPPGIGHNGGPPLSMAGSWTGHVWRKAKKQAWANPGIEVVRLRARRAAELGLDYHRYQAISMHAGRPPAALFFDLGGTLVRIVGERVWTAIDGTVALLPGVADKLRGLKVPSVYVVSNQSAVAAGLITEAEAHGYVEQVNAAGDHRIADHRICTAGRNADHPWRKPRPGMVIDLLQCHRLPPSAAIMIGDAMTDEACAGSAGLAGFIWANDYFTAAGR